MLRGLKPFDPETLELQFLPDTDELIIYSEFAMRLTSLVFDYRLGQEEFTREALELLEYFRAKVYLREDQLFRLIDELGGFLADLKNKYGIDALTLGVKYGNM